MRRLVRLLSGFGWASARFERAPARPRAREQLPRRRRKPEEARRPAPSVFATGADASATEAGAGSSFSAGRADRQFAGLLAGPWRLLSRHGLRGFRLGLRRGRGTMRRMQRRPSRRSAPGCSPGLPACRPTLSVQSLSGSTSRKRRCRVRCWRRRRIAAPRRRPNFRPGSGLR